MKKRLVTLVSLFILTLVLAACGDAEGAAGTDASEEDGENVELVMWYWGDEIEEIEEKVNNKFENIDLEIQQQPSGEDYRTRLQTLLAGGGDGPDIVAMDSWVTDFLPNHEMFVNLYDHGAEELEDVYLDWKLDMAKIDTEAGEKLIALPIDIGPTGLFYRADLFEEAGLPSEPEEVEALLQDWDDYLAAAKQLAEETGAKMYTPDEIYRNVIGQAEQLYFNEDGEFIADGDHVKYAFDTAIKAYEEDITIVSNSGSEKRAMIGTGDVGSLIHASWFTGDVVTAGEAHAGEWRMAVPPGGGGNQGGSFLGVLASTEYPEEAYEVIKYILSPENQLDSLVNYGLFPSTPEVYDAPEMQEEVEFFGGQVINDVFARSAESVNIVHRTSNDTLVENVILEQLLLVVNEGKDSEQAWEDAMSRAESQLDL